MADDCASRQRTVRGVIAVSIPSTRAELSAPAIPVVLVVHGLKRAERADQVAEILYQQGSMQIADAAEAVSALLTGVPLRLGGHDFMAVDELRDLLIAEGCLCSLVPG